MAETVIHSDLTVEQWADDAFYTFQRSDPFKKFKGTSEDSVIQVKEDLETKAGNSIWFQLVKDLNNDEVVDDDMLEGNEEHVDNYGMQVFVHQRRNATVIGQYEEIKTTIDMRKASKTMLRMWLEKKARDRFIARAFSPCTDGITTYSAATVAQRNTWATTNNPAVANQRILYGATKANYTGVHATDLTAIDAVNDDLHQDMIRLMKRMAQSCDPLIRPWKVNDSEGASREGFVAMVGSLPFRDLEANFETVEASIAARGNDNRIFAGGSLRIGNVLVIEVPEMDRAPASGGCWLQDVGAGGTVDVEPIFFMGSQALLYPIAKRLFIKTKQFDYDNRYGVAFGMIDGCAKATFNQIQHGMVTGWASAQGD
jgi:N4-gp56 family major capsid protein